MAHSARMGILRSARDMGRDDLIISTADEILSTSAGPDTDRQEVLFAKATALANTDLLPQATDLWTSLARDPSTLYGTRAAFELADVHFRAGRLDQAHSAISALIDANPPHQYWLARSFILLSDILRAQGADFEADEYLHALRSNYPGTDADIFQLIDQRLTPKQ